MSTDTAPPPGSLPPGHAALEPFVASWALPTLAARARRRDESSAAERQALYDAMKDRAPAILAQLDARPFDQLDEAERRLLALLLSYAHVALAIEVRGDGEAAHAAHRRHMAITHEPGWSDPR